MTRNPKILCLLDMDKGRDVEILMPVIYFIETKLNIDVEIAFMWDVHLIYQKKPDIILLANAIGAPWHFEISKYANENNIKLFALISEGNFRTDGSFNYFGYNTDEKFYQDFICHWSKRTLDFLNTVLPEYKDKNVLTGATGFDRYKIYNFMSKHEFLNKRKLKNYTKIIGYAGWTFGKLFNENGLSEIRGAHKENAEERIKWMGEQMILVENVLRKAIENNPDILFILKRHPNEKHPHLIMEDKNEMYNLRNYPNVVYVTDEENIHDLINISDIWLGFETTTTMEAWLLGKQTFLINENPEFKRDFLYKGSVIAHDYKQLQDIIDRYYDCKIVKEFFVPELVNMRNQIMTDIIGFYDGLNHIRAGYYFKKSLEQWDGHKVNVKFNVEFFIRHMTYQIGKYFYIRSVFLKLPKFKKTVWIFDRYKLKNIPVIKQKYYKDLDKFYVKNNLSSKLQNNEFIKSLVEE